LNDRQFPILRKFGHKKTAPPTVRVCLTIGVQFIRATSFVLFVSCYKNSSNREWFSRTTCIHIGIENRNTTVVSIESIAPLGTFYAFHRVVRKS